MPRKTCSSCIYLNSRYSKELRLTFYECRHSVYNKVQNQEWPSVVPESDWCGNFTEFDNNTADLTLILTEQRKEIEDLKLVISRLETQISQITYLPKRMKSSNMLPKITSPSS
jgi:hypothetical protein